MTVTAATLTTFCRQIMGGSRTAEHATLAGYLAAIPRLAALADLPAGTPVLVRGDTDAKVGPNIGDGDIRLRSMVETLSHGQARGWKQIVFGHIGRKPEGSLSKVAQRIGALLSCPVDFVPDWLDDATATVSSDLRGRIAAAAPGSILVLENTRKYKLETLLWKATDADLPELAPRLATLADEVAAKIARVYVHEAFSAGSLDASSIVIPAAMDRVALGSYAAGEFERIERRCQRARLVVMSGLKIDKLDDLQAMISRGTIRWVFVAGSLAMALKKADAQLNGGDFCIGVAEDVAQKDKPTYIPPERIEQARRMLTEGRAQGIRFVLPVDFVLQDGRAATAIGPADQQFDTGPKTAEHFAAAVGEFLAESRGGEPVVAFHNGVFGMFEDPRFEAGTKAFVPQLKRLKDAGVEVYVGGGEGGAALEKYGQPDWVTHCFTAGGTVLNALGSEPVPFLTALALRARQLAG